MFNIPILGPIVNIANTWLEGRQKLQQAEVNNRARLLESEASHNSEWEMAQIVDKDKWLRRISFSILSAPFLYAAYDPFVVKDYFEIALSTMPEWYIQMYVAVIGSVWGISAMKNTLGGVLGAMRKK